jgi:hypothetical protein
MASPHESSAAKVTKVWTLEAGRVCSGRGGLACKLEKMPAMVIAAPANTKPSSGSP